MKMYLEVVQSEGKLWMEEAGGSPTTTCRKMAALTILHILSKTVGRQCPDVPLQVNLAFKF